MKKKVFITLSLVLLIGVSVFGLTGCNFAAKHFGGTMDLDLPADQKLVNVTWKEDSLWYLTKPMTEKDVAEDYMFQCDSNFGVFEGTVNIHETKSEEEK